MTTTNTIPVRFYKQGGHQCEGLAIGRKGSSFLIQYRITNGEQRERWLPAKRIISWAAGYNENTLPRYTTKTCKATTFDKPLTEAEFEERFGSTQSYDMPPCEKCGEKHRITIETVRKNVTTEEAKRLPPATDIYNCYDGGKRQHYILVRTFFGFSPHSLGDVLVDAPSSATEAAIELISEARDDVETIREACDEQQMDLSDMVEHRLQDAKDAVVRAGGLLSSVQPLAHFHATKAEVERILDLTVEEFDAIFETEVN